MNLEGVSSRGAQSLLLTAPRRINPGAVASTGPCELIFLGRKRRCSFVSANTGAATGRTSAVLLRLYTDGVRLVQVVLNVANSK